MTRQEIKEELKHLEGDLLRKARLRSLALDCRRKSMIAAATLVVANPTHYAKPFPGKTPGGLTEDMIVLMDAIADARLGANKH
jgi:hypothetical protein